MKRGAAAGTVRGGGGRSEAARCYRVRACAKSGRSPSSAEPSSGPNISCLYSAVLQVRSQEQTVDTTFRSHYDRWALTGIFKEQTAVKHGGVRECGSIAAAAATVRGRTEF